MARCGWWLSKDSRCAAHVSTVGAASAAMLRESRPGWPTASRAMSVDVASVATRGGEFVDARIAEDVSQGSIDARGHAGEAAADVDACAFVHVAANFITKRSQAILHVARAMRL